MPDINNGALLEVVIHSTNSGQRQMTVLHYRLTDLGAPADQWEKLEAVDDRFAAVDGIYDAIADVSGNDCEFQPVQLQWIFPERYAFRTFGSMPLLGQAVQGCEVSGVAATITKRGVESGRHNIGSVHMPNCPKESIASSMWSDPNLTLYGTLATRLRTPFTLATGGTLTPVIFNKANPALSVEVFGTTLQPEVRYQRRRTVGLGI